VRERKRGGGGSKSKIAISQQGVKIFLALHRKKNFSFFCESVVSHGIAKTFSP